AVVAAAPAAVVILAIAIPVPLAIPLPALALATLPALIRVSPVTMIVPPVAVVVAATVVVAAASVGATAAVAVATRVAAPHTGAIRLMRVRARDGDDLARQARERDAHERSTIARRAEPVAAVVDVPHVVALEHVVIRSFHVVNLRVRNQDH